MLAKIVIPNPWAKENFTRIFSKHGLINDHKVWEVEAYKYSPVLFEFGTELTTKRHHAGLQIDLTLFGYTISFQIYDNRHWDIEINDWEKDKK